MANNKYSEEEIKYVVDNYGKKSKAEICDRLKIKKANFSSLINLWRKKGYAIPRVRLIEQSQREGHKICAKKTCRREKPISDFQKSKKSKDGYHSYCKKCASEVQRQYRINNPDVVERQRKAEREKRLKNVKVGRPRKLRKLELVIDESLILDDNSIMPEGYFKDCKMIDVPAWHLLELYNSEKCSQYVKIYIEENLETLKMENKR